MLYSMQRNHQDLILRNVWEEEQTELSGCLNPSAQQTRSLRWANCRMQTTSSNGGRVTTH